MIGLDIKFRKLDLVLQNKQFESLSLKFGTFEENFLNLSNDDRNKPNDSIFNIFSENIVHLDTVLSNSSLEAKIYSNSSHQIIGKGKINDLKFLDDYQSSNKSFLRSTSNSCSINLLGGMDVDIELVHSINSENPPIKVGSIHLSLCIYRLMLINKCGICKTSMISSSCIQNVPEQVAVEEEEEEYPIAISSDSDSSINEFMKRFDKKHNKAINDVLFDESDFQVRRSVSSQTKKVPKPHLIANKNTFINSMLTSYPAPTSMMRANKRVSITQKSKKIIKNSINKPSSSNIQIASMTTPIQQTKYRVLMDKTEAENYSQVLNSNNFTAKVSSHKSNIALNKNNSECNYVDDSIAINHYSRTVPPIHQPDPIPLYFQHS